MINQDVKQTLKNCKIELIDIKGILSSGTQIPFSRITKYLTNYAIITSCGTIEYSYKCLIADFFEKDQSDYIKNFLSKRIRESSANPEMSNIHRLLNSFNKVLNRKFKNELDKESDKNKWIKSLDSLRDARNKLAHGRSTYISFLDVLNYYEDSRNILNVLDKVLNETSNIPNLSTLFFD